MKDIFSLSHIMYMLTMTGINIGIIFLIRFICKKDFKKLRIAVAIMAAILLIVMLINKFAIWQKYDNNWKVFVPGSFCSALAIIGPLVMFLFKPNTKTFTFAMFGQALGGLLTTIYPEFMIGQSNFFDLINFTGLLFHTLMFVNFVVVIGIGYFKPNFKNWAGYFWGIVAMIPYIIFNCQIFGVGEDIYLQRPAIEGTNLYWWAIGLLSLVLYTVFLLIYEQFAFKKEERFSYNVWVKSKSIYNKIFIRNKKEIDNKTDIKK